MNKFEASQVIQQRREKNEHDRILRIRWLENASPEYAKLVRDRNALLAEAAILRLKKDRKTANEKEQKAKELNEREGQILKELNLPDDYLTVHYDCPKCKDRGYTLNGKICSCLEELIKKAVLNQYDMTDRIVEDNFENFDLDLYDDESLGDRPSPRYMARLNRLKGKNFCASFGEKSPSLLIAGPVGTGKTYIASCIANELINQGVGIIYISAPNLIQMLHEDINQKTPIRESHRQAFKDAELLIIDDLGTEGATDFNLSAISEILDQRLVFNKKTVITTNYELAEMLRSGRYPERMVSRIMQNYDMMQFTGQDLRQKKKFKKSKKQN